MVLVQDLAWRPGCSWNWSFQAWHSLKPRSFAVVLHRPGWGLWWDQASMFCNWISKRINDQTTTLVLSADDILDRKTDNKAWISSWLISLDRMAASKQTSLPSSFSKRAQRFNLGEWVELLVKSCKDYIQQMCVDDLERPRVIPQISWVDSRWFKNIWDDWSFQWQVSKHV